MNNNYLKKGFEKANKMLEKKFDIEFISECTGLTVNEINELQ